VRRRKKNAFLIKVAIKIFFLIGMVNYFSSNTVTKWPPSPVEPYLSLGTSLQVFCSQLHNGIIITNIFLNSGNSSPVIVFSIGELSSKDLVRTTPTSEDVVPTK
jgi:hypothetical protein